MTYNARTFWELAELKFIDDIKRDDLFRAGSLMFIATVIAGSINFFFHIVMGNLLSPETYGEFSALYALFFFLSYILIKTLRDINARFVSKFKGRDYHHLIPLFHSRMTIRMLIFGTITLLIFSAASGFFTSFLHISSNTLVLLVGLAFVFTWIIPINSGTMQGLQRFKNLSAIIIFQASAKFIIGTGLVIIGFGIFGAIIGLVIGLFLVLILSFYLVRDVVKLRFTKSKSSLIDDPSKIEKLRDNETRMMNLESSDVAKFSLHVLIAVSCLTIPTNIDILIVKHFFTSQETALYTAASVFGKMIYFLPVGITLVMYPKVVEAQTKMDGTWNILTRSIIYTIVPTGLIVLMLWLFPSFFLGLFYPDVYTDASSILRLYGPFMFFFSLISVLVHYNMALNRYGFIYFFACYSISGLALIWFHHESLEQILQIFLGISIIFFFLGYMISLRYPHKTEPSR